MRPVDGRDKQVLEEGELDALLGSEEDSDDHDGDRPTDQH